jgi:phosphoribosylformylglycinamidine cyclo-ligase
MTNTPQNKTTYADSGVNIDAGYALVERIKPFTKLTERSGVMGGIGGFGGLFDLKASGYNDAVLVAATDGVGTKLKLAQIVGKHDTIGIDLVAMCVNDLLAQAAEPLFFLDYFACGKLEVDVAAEVIKGIAEGCLQAGCALIGGETAEMPSMYEHGEYDLAGFVVGAAQRQALLPLKEDMKEGDALIAIGSSGVHSNGYSLVRRLIADNNVPYDAPAPWDAAITVGESLLIPTKIYVKSCLPLMRNTQAIKGFAHITGGGLTENLPRILPQHLAATVQCDAWQLPALFAWFAKAGNLDDVEMLNTFNCGVGGVLLVEADHTDAVIEALHNAGETAWLMGHITTRKGDKPIEYQGNIIK